MKCSLRIRLIRESHVVVIDLCVDVSASGAVVLVPRAVKRMAAPKRNERSKLGDGNLQRGKGCPKHWVNGLTVFRPFRMARVQSVERAKH